VIGAPSFSTISAGFFDDFPGSSTIFPVLRQFSRLFDNFPGSSIIFPVLR